MENKTAVIIDSGTDVPQTIIDDYDIRVLPLRIIYTDGEYLDRVNIEAETIYHRLSEEVPKTSLPSGADIEKMFVDLKDEGFTQAIVICISSGLSGTYNAIRLATQDIEGLEVAVIDTRNISIGSGFIAIEAARRLRKGQSFEAIVQHAQKSVGKSNVFFTVATLEYLKKGGRIGLVAGTVAEIMNIKPIISCNEDGVYYTMTKVRGRKKSIQAIMEKAKEFIEVGNRYRVCALEAASGVDFDQLQQALLQFFPDAIERFSVSISPALGVHTGPGALGIGIELIDDED